MPIVLGVLGGSFLGSRLLSGARTRSLRVIFALTIVALGAEMLYNGIGGRF